MSKRVAPGTRPECDFSLAAVCACALLGLCAPAADASPNVRFGIQDDAWLAHGGGTLDERLDRLEQLGVDVVRFNLHWDQIEPTRGEYAWEDSDAVLNGLRSRGIPAVVGIVGTPGWANGGRAKNFAPGASSFAGFARAAATRYRWVKQWLMWNEPNQARWLRPTSPSVYVRQILNPGYAAIHAVIPGAKVAGGVTAPRGSSGGVSPVKWIRGMRSARARLDAYAHHPYPSSSRETPFTGGCGHCETITMATLEKLIAEVGRAFGPKRIWLTEYAYQTGAYGVTQQRQAELLGQSGLRAHKAARVDMLIHYLVKDEPQASRFQSGLFNIAGRPEARRARVPAADRPGRAERRQARALGSGPSAQRRPVVPRPGPRRRRRVALQRRDAQHERARLLQHARRGAGGRERSHPLAAGRRLQRHDPRPLDACAQLRSERARATCPLRRLRLPRRMARDRALPLRLRDRALPRVRAGPAPVGRAPSGPRRAARDLLRRRQPHRLRGRAPARLAAEGQDRAGDAPERDPDRHVRDRPDGDRRRRRTLGGAARRPDRADRSRARLLRRRLRVLHLRVARRRARATR